VNCNDDWQNYESGVLDSKTCDSDPEHLDHQVLIVAYTPDAWTLKNSW
jgi:hypothetical protein